MCQTNAGQDIKFSWDEATLKSRYLQILWNVHKLMLNLAQENKINPFKLDEKKVEKNLGMEERYIFSKLHSTIKKVTEDIVAFKFNTAVSAMMILVNEFSTSSNSIGKKQMEAFLKILAPFAPHLAEELWLKLGHKTSIHKEKWPKYDENLIKENLVSIIVQVNGRVRSTMKVVADSDEEHVREMAQADSNVKKHLEGKEIKKVIYIPGKIINYVIKESGFPPSRE